MRLLYSGTGTLGVDRCGEVNKPGDTIEVPDEIGKALIKQDPDQWSEDRPAPKKQSARVKAER
jgi:hypothetical protein